jgi:membrane-bound lytic murein transglycosylase B
VSAAVSPIAAAGGQEGWEPTTPAIAAAAERIQQLRTLIAHVETGVSTQVGESGPAGTTFASALDSAQSEATGPPVTAGAYTPPIEQAAARYGLDPAQSETTGPTATAESTAAAGAYTPLIEQAAARYGLDPAILQGLIQQESGFDPSARSSAGALGLTQLMPSTAASLGVSEPLDPAQSIEGGARYLSQLLHQFAGNTADALAAYNAGPGAVQQYGGVPPYAETQQYVTDVLGYAASYQEGGAA